MKAGCLSAVLAGPGKTRPFLFEVIAHSATDRPHAERAPFPGTARGYGDALEGSLAHAAAFTPRDDLRFDIFVGKARTIGILVSMGRREA